MAARYALEEQEAVGEDYGVMVPSGTVTLLFTDIEGSTRLWEARPVEMGVALARHDMMLREAIQAAGGVVFKTVGDAFCAAFTDAAQAVTAAVTAQRAVGEERWPEGTPIRVRMALHSGVCEERDSDYFGPPVNRVARLEATAHGGQIVLSALAAELVRDRLPEDLSLLDLGHHRLKDLGRPEHVFQISAVGLRPEFPPLRSLSNPELATNLPEQMSSFVGRDGELAELRASLGRSRLVTLTGPGGTGKTRLALQAGAELLDGSADGVWLADLSSLADADRVAATVASVLGVREELGRPMLETLVDAVHDRSLLVVLDNCEHVIDAAAKVVDVVLRSCPKVVVLATSREPLGITGEQVYRVPPLSLPDADETEPRGLGDSEAVQLFVDRACQHQPGFAVGETNAAVVGRLCRRLDGMPLAIELAAARLRSLSVQDLEGRLDQRFRLLTGGVRTALPRHQTLQALIDWSWDLLSSPERIVLGRLSIFAGSWDLEAAEAVAEGGDVDHWDVLDHLGVLVDKSLVSANHIGGTIRYRLLETVREYAYAKLVELGSAEIARVRTTHRDHFLVLAETAAPHLTSHGQDEWFDRLVMEHDNLRAALAHSLTDADPDRGLRLGIALSEFWEFRGQIVEGIEIVTALLDRVDTHTTSLTRGWALATVAALSVHVGDLPAAIASGDEALVISRVHCDERLAATALATLSLVRKLQGDPGGALALNATGLASARAVADADLIGRLLNIRGRCLEQQGDTPECRALYQEAVELFRKTGNEIRANRALSNLSFLELASGDLDAARATIGDMLTAAQARSDHVSVVVSAFNLGLVELTDHDVPAARNLFTRSLITARRIGEQEGLAYALLGLALTVHHPLDLAATLHGAADAAMDRLGIRFERLEAGLRETDRARLCAELGDGAFEGAYDAGRNMPRDDAVTLALQLS